MPCPLYCTNCYASVPNCDSCLASTNRMGSDCTLCQSHMYIIAGQLNCQQCGMYCDECNGCATNCITCSSSLLRINPPLCAICPSQMFIQSGLDNCQQCATYCNECVGTSTACVDCELSTLRTGPPFCTTCPLQMFIQANFDNCQQCSTYCDGCTTIATNCTQCNTVTFRINPPSCQTCPAQQHLVYNNLNCQPCQLYCNNCQPYTSQCIACSSSSLRLNPPDCLDCPHNYYLNENTCTKCDESCQTCNSNRCLTCLSNQYIDSFGKCITCPSHCLTCDINTCYSCANNCAACNLTSCLRCSQDNYYLQGTSCYSCPQNYLTCNISQCLTCIGPRTPINNECLCKWPCLTCDSYQCTTCISSQYRLQNQICLFCPEECVACDQIGNCYKEPSNCQIGIYVSALLIQCTVCRSNYYLYDNLCIQCSEECLECNHQPYYCTICRFQSLNLKECKLCESQPGLYSNYQTNTCYSICGDGITNGIEQCDDGNMIHKDGCSNCKIDTGYFCEGMLCQPIIYPIPFIIQNTILDSVYNANKYFILSYNVPIKYQHFNIQLQIVNLTAYSYGITQINNQSFNISISLDEQLIDAQLQLIFTNIDQILTDYGFHQQIDIIYCSMSDYIVMTSQDQELSDSTNTIMNYLFIIIAIFICLAIIFGGLQIFWNLLDLFQTMSYLKYINTAKPYYLYTFLNLFGFLQIKNLPLNLLVFIENYISDEININQFRTPPELINEDGFTTSTMINIIPLANVLFTAVGVYILAFITLEFMDSTVLLLNPNYLLKYIKVFNLLYKFKSFLVNSCRRIISQFLWSGLIRIFISSAYDICFTICLGLYGLQFDNLSWLIEFDLSVTIFLTFCYLFITLLISLIASLDSKTLQQKLNEYGAVCEGLKLYYFMKQNNSILLIKKMLFMIFLVLLYNEPLFQISNIIAIQISQLLYFIIMDPIADKKEKQKQLLCEFFMLVAEIQLAILVIDDYWMLFIHSTRRIFGWICVFALVIIVLSQIVIDVHQQAQYYYKRSTVVRKYWQSLKNIFSGQPVQQISLQDIII